jgi:hypothetical protein
MPDNRLHTAGKACLTKPPFARLGQELPALPFSTLESSISLFLLNRFRQVIPQHFESQILSQSGICQLSSPKSRGIPTDIRHNRCQVSLDVHFLAVSLLPSIFPAFCPPWPPSSSLCVERGRLPSCVQRPAGCWMARGILRSASFVVCPGGETGDAWLSPWSWSSAGELSIEVQACPVDSPAALHPRFRGHTKEHGTAQTTSSSCASMPVTDFGVILRCTSFAGKRRRVQFARSRALPMTLLLTDGAGPIDGASGIERRRS